MKISHGSRAHITFSLPRFLSLSLSLIILTEIEYRGKYITYDEIVGKFTWDVRLVDRGFKILVALHDSKLRIIKSSRVIDK